MTTTTPTDDYFILAGALGALGNSADEVAQTLRDLGIKGTHSSASCPIATYLNAQPTSDVAFVGTCGPYSYVTSHDTDFDLRHPPAVQEFVAEFDSNHYPDLEFRSF